MWDQVLNGLRVRELVSVMKIESHRGSYRVLKCPIGLAVSCASHEPSTPSCSGLYSIPSVGLFPCWDLVKCLLANVTVFLKFSSDESDESDECSEELVEGDYQCDTGDSIPECSVSLSVAVKSGDLASIVNLKEQLHLTDQEKFYVLDHSFMPHSGYNCPSHTINECKRHLQRRWLSTYNGFVYSESTNGGYCKYCVLFARCSMMYNILTPSIIAIILMDLWRLWPYAVAC